MAQDESKEKTGPQAGAKAQQGESSEPEETQGPKGTSKQPERRVKIKPELDDATRAALELRAQTNKRRPAFRRPEWFRYKKLSRSGWRRPFGLHNKQRRHYGYRPNVVSVGYGGPAATRGLHPSGFREVLIHNVGGLEEIDPKVQAARIAKGVGSRKRELIEDEAQRLKIRILNPMPRRGDEE